MANETLGASFSIDVTDLKAGLQQANRMIRESESEFKAAAAGMGDWRDSQEGLTAKIKSLNKITEAQQAKVDALQKEYDNLIDSGLDPTSKAAVELRTKINNETAALKKNQTEAKKLENALDKMGDEAKDAGNSMSDMGDAAGGASEGFAALQNAGGVAVGIIGAVVSACVAAVGAFLGLAESTREARTNMARLVTAFESAELGAQAAEDTFTELYGILGDDGAATEAAQQLAKMSKDEADLAANTRILTGVMAEYGASIPTEGLAEGMAATAAMGSVQGVLADALEWQGVVLDDYNAALAELATEEERAAYIQSTLTDLYGASADAYRENNAEVIAANEAQAGLNQTLNDLGAIAEPIMTTLKQLATELLGIITPFVALIGEGLTDALNGAAGAADKMAEGLTGIISTLLEKIVEILPFIIETVISIFPKLVTALLGQLPTIVQTLLTMAAEIISAVSEMLPSIVEAVLTVIPLLISAIIGAIPQILAAAIQLLMSIVEAVPQIVVGLLTALPQIIQTILGVLLDAIPLIINGAIELLMGIVKAIPIIITSLLTALPQIVEALISGILGAVPLLLDAAVELLFAIIDAIPQILGALYGAVPKIYVAIIKILLSAIPQIIVAAVKLLMGIIKAIPTIIVKLVQSIPEIITAIVQGLSEGVGELKDVGGDMLAGLFDGLLDPKAIWKAVKDLYGGIVGGLKDLFDINSPSQVMADVIGKNLALGIGEGFADNIAGVNKQIAGAVDVGGVGVVGNINRRAGGGVVVYQTNHYSQAHSRIELYKSKQATAAAVRLAMQGA
jgi:hypothetical protein